VDTCAYIEPDTLHDYFPTTPEMQSGLCLCLSGIQNAVQTDWYLILYNAYLGNAVLTAGLTDLIDNGGGVCTYPPGATPVCSQSDPCGFQC
ncbi:hypothetical protein FA95DRAFT_1474207, partial [Auriscalpium vulgare]